jgi:hypothetical protein
VKRIPPDTSPPTYTAGEVSRILKGKVTEVLLERWDKSGVLRPSFYHAMSKLLSPSERDAQVLKTGVNQGNPRRRYTYQDLVWLRLFVYVRDHYEAASVPNPGRKSAKVIASIRKLTNNQCPATSRLLFAGRNDVYLIDDQGIAENVGQGGQLAMRTLLTETIFAEVTGRIAVLEASNDIRSLGVIANGRG